MPEYEIGKLEFDMYYGEDSDKQLTYQFEILKPDGDNEAVFIFEECKPINIDRVVAQLYADGWQMIQLTEEFDTDKDDPTQINIWFREAYFHRPKR